MSDQSQCCSDIMSYHMFLLTSGTDSICMQYCTCIIAYYVCYCCVCTTTAYDIDSVNGETVLRETLELLPKPNYNLLKYIRYQLLT